MSIQRESASTWAKNPGLLPKNRGVTCIVLYSDETRILHGERDYAR